MMTRYALNLPAQLKQDAEAWASRQGISLNQFVLWAVAEKVGALRQQLDDPAYPHITYRRGTSGQLAPVLRATNLRVQTVDVAARQWGLSPAEIATAYGVTEAQVADALRFAEAHRQEIDASITAEQAIEQSHA